MNRTATWKIIGILISIFLVSVLVRYPNLNRPLSKHHEFVTAIPLRVLQIWEQEGAYRYAFNPVMNFPGKANKNINNHASTSETMIDKEGNYYYVSHPQFAYIFPYLVFKLLNIKTSVLSIQIFHLVINFFSAAFIYLIITLLSIQKPFKKLFIPGLIGFCIYLFSPSVLWFQSNTYMSDMLVHLPFVLAVYTMLKLLMRKQFYSVKYLIYYAVFLFLMIYTSWLGIFFAFAVFLYSMVKLRYEKVFLPLVFITLGVSFFTVMLIFKQYSLINGPEAYLIQMLDRFSERGSLGGETFFGFMFRKIMELKTILLNYTYSYFPIFILVLVFSWLTISKPKMGLVFTKNGYRFLWLSTLPILLLHFFLMNYSGHDFVSLYGSLFLSVLVGVLYSKLKKVQVLNPYILNGGVLAVLITSLGMYYFINRPGDFSWKGDEYAISMKIGNYIKAHNKSNEVVFIEGNVTLDPQLIYYAERNILRLEEKNLKRFNATKNKVLFRVVDSDNIEEVR